MAQAPWRTPVQDNALQTCDASSSVEYAISYINDFVVQFQNQKVVDGNPSPDLQPNRAQG
jgi:hypothetical protein